VWAELHQANALPSTEREATALVWSTKASACKDALQELRLALDDAKALHRQAEEEEGDSEADELGISKEDVASGESCVSLVQLAAFAVQQGGRLLLAASSSLGAIAALEARVREADAVSALVDELAMALYEGDRIALRRRFDELKAAAELLVRSVATVAEGSEAAATVLPALTAKLARCRLPDTP